MTRADTVAQLSELASLMMDRWAAIAGQHFDTFEEHWQGLWLLDGSVVTDATKRPIKPLEDGRDMARAIGVPPVEPHDPRAVMVVMLAPGGDGQVGRVEVLLEGRPLAGQVDGTANGGTPWLVARFESPEWRFYEGEGGQRGRHDFHHVQLSGERRMGSRPAGETLPRWFPASELAIPLPANDPVDLVLCAIASVRSLNLLLEMKLAMGRQLRDRVERLAAAVGAFE